MNSLQQNGKPLLNLFHIVAVAPVMCLLGTNKFPEGLKKYLVYLSVLIALYHLFKLSKYVKMNQHGVVKSSGVIENVDPEMEQPVEMQ
jgi:hypothetical protein